MEGRFERAAARLAVLGRSSGVRSTEVDQDCRGVVMGLAATARRGLDGVLRSSDATNQLGRSLCVEHLDQVDPVEEVESLNEAGGAVGEDGGTSQLLGRYGQLDGLFGCFRFGAGDPKSPGLVALVSHVLGFVAGQSTGTLVCDSPDAAGQVEQDW